MTSRRHRSWRLAYWLGLILSLIGSMYFLNLVIYHFWAAYVPPYRTALHIHLARYSAEILGLFVALFIWCTFRLWRSRERMK